MKKTALFISSLLLALNAFAIDGAISVNTPNASLNIVGRGDWVCSAEDSFKHVPELGRGVTRTEAEINATAECAKTGKSGAFFCRILSCERDKANAVDITAIFDIVRNQSSVNINFRGNVKFACYAKTFNSAYTAKAATRTEASALAKKICAEDEGVRRNQEANGFFCNGDSNSCEQISGVNGKVDIGGIIGGIIGKKKKK